MSIETMSFRRVRDDYKRRISDSNFEFKYRFWLFDALFGKAFSSYGIDHGAAGIALAEWIARLRGTSATNLDYHLVFAMGATLIAGLIVAVRLARVDSAEIQKMSPRVKSAIGDALHLAKSILSSGKV